MAANNNPTTEVLAGLVERVTFHNEDNGFLKHGFAGSRAASTAKENIQFNRHPPDDSLGEGEVAAF